MRVKSFLISVIIVTLLHRSVHRTTPTRQMTYQQTTVFRTAAFKTISSNSSQEPYRVLIGQFVLSQEVSPVDDVTSGDKMYFRQT